MYLQTLVSLASRFIVDAEVRLRHIFSTCNLGLYNPSPIYMYLQSRLIQLWKQVNTKNTKKKKPIQLGPQKMKDTIEIQNYVCSYFSMVNHTHLSSKILRSIRHVSANLLLKFWSPQYASDAPLHSKTTSECVP